MSRPKAMMAHYLRSLDEEKEYEEWDSGLRDIPADENRYRGRSYRFGRYSLIERGRSNPEFISSLNMNVHVCRCGEPSVGELFGRLYCDKCFKEMNDAWNTAMRDRDV